MKMDKNDIFFALCMLLQALSFVSLWLGKSDVAIIVMLQSIFLQLMQNQKD